MNFYGTFSKKSFRRNCKMKVGVIGAGTMGQGIAKAFAMVDGY